MSSLLEEFRQVGRDLYAAGLVSSHGGNLSVRRGLGVVVTCHGSRLGHLDEGDLVEVASGIAVRFADSASGGAAAEPSMDLALHQAIYDGTSARAVVHAHPRYAIALSLIEKEIRPQDLEGQHYLGVVPVVARGDDLSPGSTQALAQALAEVLRGNQIAVVAGHGSYARGDSLWQALQWTSVLEESAQVVWLLRALTRQG
jgi:L-fuculose-phosphate aldolase